MKDECKANIIIIKPREQITHKVLPHELNFEGSQRHGNKLVQMLSSLSNGYYRIYLRTQEVSAFEVL